MPKSYLQSEQVKWYPYLRDIHIQSSTSTAPVHVGPYLTGYLATCRVDIRYTTSTTDNRYMGIFMEILHCTGKSYQSSGTGGSRYSCWRVPVNCTGSTAILIYWIRWTLLTVDFAFRRHIYCHVVVTLESSLCPNFFTLPPLPWLYTAVCCSGDCALPI